MHRQRVLRHGSTVSLMPRDNHCGKQCPAARHLWAHIDYLQKTEVYKAKAAKWDAANKDRKRELMARDDVKEKARLRIRAWVKKNPERNKENTLKFRAENRALVRSYQARRRARVRQAVPPWITDEQVVAVQAIYAESERLSVATGIEHEVDHILPLAGKVIFGLHVPWNLRVLTRDDNNRRPRIPSRADLDALGEDQMAWLRTQGLALPRASNQ